MIVSFPLRQILTLTNPDSSEMYPGKHWASIGRRYTIYQSSGPQTLLSPKSFCLATAAAPLIHLCIESLIFPLAVTHAVLFLSS